MNVTIEIHYKADSRSYQKGDFPLRRRKPEEVALEFWRQIKKELSYSVQLEKIILNGDFEITELVRELEKQEWRKVEDNLDLPF